jgi:ribonuclease HI
MDIAWLHNQRSSSRVTMAHLFRRSLGATGARAAAILTPPSGIKLRYAVRLHFKNEADKRTNNITEYEVILLGLQKLRAIGVQRCIIRTYSKVVARQIEKECLSLVRRTKFFFQRFHCRVY